ncbi:MAG: S8 family serine peptidase, partial [Actinomycetota bacterium]|nr:S8 family serine peptidase [Actinomycetota bacterium]
GDALYVFPSDAAPLLGSRLDPELFNVTKLADYGYDDGVPVIMTRASARAAAGTGGLSVTMPLTSVGGYAATVGADGAWWSATTRSKAPAVLAGGAKMWLDEVAEVELAESVPMIGAPAAWADGFDGTGTTVAVLDTGIDATHPDLAGQIAGTRNFTTEADMRDGHGHGTHVASTVAGTGAGSGGTYTGVAPGADLLIGKICTAGGSCPNSATIAGMEWAAQNADVVSISIGSNVGNDGSSPTALAVNRLTARYDTLFVIAAANNGSQGAGSIGAPGSADAALTVGAVDKNGALAPFSSRGPRLGDFAIKPDITAPGVGIAAARAEGTTMGTPVNASYTRANGTSMATPHVAGAAAIVHQQNPDLGAAELKALLASTATPNENLSVYEQGGGLTAIPAALAAPVLATPAPLNLGFFPYGEKAEPVTRTVTYTNRTDADVTLDLALQVTGDDGGAVPGSALAVSPATVTVPAGGTATADVTLNPDGLATGSYGGHLVAASTGGQVRTPVGFHLEAEMYDVVINGITRTGKPAATSSSLHIRHAVDTDIFAKNSLTFSGGAVRLRVPPGRYHVGGVIATLDGTNTTKQDRTVVTVPNLNVTGDTTVTLDARQANEITFATPEHPDARPHDQSRLIYHFASEQDGDITATWLGPWERTYALASEAPEVGDFELFVNARVGDAPLVLQVVDPGVTELHPRPLTGSPAPDRDERLPLVFAGQGTEADYAGLDVTGKVVLTERAGPTPAAKEATARAHGATALLIMNDTTGTFSGAADAAEIPALSVSGEEGTRLRDLLADGAVTLRLAGTPYSPYLYDLFLSEQDRIPADPHYEVRPAQLATLHNSFHGPADHAMGEYRAAWRPYMGVGAVQYSRVRGGSERVEYVTADDTKFRQTVAAGGPALGAIQERDLLLSPGEKRERDWFKGPVRPGILDPLPPLNPGYPATRTGNTMSLQVMEWFDNDVHYGAYHSTYDTGRFRVFSDGVQLGQTTWPRVSVTNLDPAPHTYRFEVDIARKAPWWPTSTATSTAWTITSQAAATRQVLPFLMVDYDTDLDLTNTAAHPRTQRGSVLDLDVRHQAGADAGAVAGAKVWISYDDGATWEGRPVRNLGEGRFQAILPSKDAEDTNGFAAIKVEAWDADGNRVEQEVTRAWRMSTR